MPKDEVCQNLSHSGSDSYQGVSLSSTGRQAWHRGAGYVEDLGSVLTLCHNAKGI